LLNENFSHLKEITPSPGYLKHWEFCKLITKAFGPKIFSRDGFQGIRIDSKHGSFGDRTRPLETQSDQLTKHLFSSLLTRASHFERIHTIAQKSPTIKQRYQISIFFIVFVLFRFIA